MKTVKHILLLVFGILGAVYLAIGLTMGAAGQAACAPDHTEYILSRVFGGLGLAFLLAAALVALLMGRSERRRHALLSYGIRVSATVTDIRVNHSVRVNRRSPIVVYASCVHPLTGGQVTLRSHSLWNATVSTGQAVDILFDQMDEKRYAFDIREEGRP